MRVQCDVCEKALAEVVCCADEAALCLSCDQRVHAANKLASKHQRLRLLHNNPNGSNSPLPLCDICQEKGAFIFCLEDRALVCRDCDECIHAVNTLAAGHQRFLATGVQVALESEQQHADKDSHSTKPEAPGPQTPSDGVPVASMSASNSSFVTLSSTKSSEECVEAKLQDNVPNSEKHMEEWQNIQSLDLTDLVSGYSLADMEFSKTDLAALSDQDWLTELSVFDEYVCRDSLAEVPQVPFSIYTANMQVLESSSKGKQRRDGVGSVPDIDDVSVPDIDDVSVVPDLMSFASQAPRGKRQKSVYGY
ncbi:hypothetical protein GOP47_0010493 [Adiantum capillus-veneris]|uniref:B box-type domain-containing protein n=1 Tax=Adiantum capillus-veneris TaxID=13818 RepID=A0A9D4UW43_ADICA|nr:hypothetical protein GOP47_0010493 [Adiantum capillus-veneris]